MGLRGAKGPVRAEPPAGQPWPLRVEGRLPARPDLPAGQTSFIGRALELAELAELLAAPDCRLVTIIGPGGIGKTRLALEAAAAAPDALADGGACAPLAEATTSCGTKVDCDNDACSEGPGGQPLAAGCDPCVAAVCGADPYCCNNDWDGICIGEVGTLCGVQCN